MGHDGISCSARDHLLVAMTAAKMITNVAAMGQKTWTTSAAVVIQKWDGEHTGHGIWHDSGKGGDCDSC